MVDSVVGRTVLSGVSLLVALVVGFVGGVVVSRSVEPSPGSSAAPVANSDEVDSPGHGRTPSPEHAPSQDPTDPLEIATRLQGCEKKLAVVEPLAFGVDHGWLGVPDTETRDAVTAAIDELVRACPDKASAWIELNCDEYPCLLVQRGDVSDPQPLSKCAGWSALPLGTSSHRFVSKDELVSVQTMSADDPYAKLPSHQSRTEIRTSFLLEDASPR